MAALLALLEANTLKKQRVFRDRSHPFDLYNDKEMFKKYRFTRDGVRSIIAILDTALQPRTARNRAVPPSLQVFIALRFFATGSVLDSSATIHGVSRSTTCRIIRRVAESLSQRKNEVIYLIFLHFHC